jgi:uncharacterized protein DUF885
MRGSSVRLKLSVGILAVAAFGPSVSFGSDVGQRIQRLAEETVYVDAAEHPINATYLGLPGHDGDLDTPSRASLKRDLGQIRAWKRRLAEIPLGRASLVERDDVRLLRAGLTASERGLAVYRSWDKDYSGPASAIVNVVFAQFEYLPVEGVAGATKRDIEIAWSHITSRLAKASAYIEAGQRLVSHPGHLQAVVGIQSLEGAPSFLAGALTQAAKSQLEPAAFKRFASARDSALATIRVTVQYLKAHVAKWPENFAMGAAAYDAMLRDEQLLPFTAENLAQMGADELGHGAAVQAWLVDQAREKGTPIGPESGGGLAPDGEALVGYYRDRIAELKNWMIDRGIVTIPSRLGDVKVVETPKFLQPVSPGASMQSPRLFAKETVGFYFITPPTSLADAAKRLDANEDFDRDRIWSTGAHEAMPGHFLQLSIARRHPDFVRKIQSSGVFAEGWAYYGEEMFVQLGMYGDDLDGRYYTAQWERVRGARAIVDGKLARGEWTYDQAVDFFARSSGFTPDAAKAAVAGYALGPGYVIAYTAGRLQLQNLLTEYWRRMGTKASLHDFHDRLLSYGTTPFSVVVPELLADLRKSAAEVRAAAHY